MNEFICEYKGCVWNNELGCQNDYIHVTLDSGEVIDCKELETVPGICEYCGESLTKYNEPCMIYGMWTHRTEYTCENCGKI